ncbi:anti-CBASS protein Acb1 family protein, partial [Mycetohabitans sp. B4]
MFNWLRRKDEPPQAPETPKSGGFFTTKHDLRVGQTEAWAHLQASTFQRSVADDFCAADVGMDANELENSVKRVATLRQENMPAAQVGWYASQSFIGYQLCALIAQHWLVDKACTMPGKDAIRNGYTVTVNDGTGVDAGVIDAIRREDKRFRINHHMREFVRMGRVFGIRIAMFVVQSTDPEYYAKPFRVANATWTSGRKARILGSWQGAKS